MHDLFYYWFCGVVSGVIITLLGLGQAVRSVRARGALLWHVIFYSLHEYPHAPPNPETVAALHRGFSSILELNVNRPAAYAHEPWLTQGASEHYAHASEHVRRAAADAAQQREMLSDLRVPEATHAALRCIFAIWQAENETW